MTLYAETSGVLRWLFGEAGGEAIRAALASARHVVTSRLTLIETRRAERDGRLSAAECADVLAVFAQAATTWAILEISDEVVRRAEDPFPSEPVRTLDAIHLASALFLRQSFPDLELVSADERIRANATLLGLRTGPGPKQR